MRYTELFTVEEMNLICIYDISTRSNLKNDLVTALHDVYEPEMIALFGTVLAKLDNITDDEFIQIGFYAADEFDEVED